MFKRKKSPSLSRKTRTSPTAKQLNGASVGYGLRDQDGFGYLPIIASLPVGSTGYTQSVCGLKGFMIDEGRRFRGEDGKLGKVVRCAKVAQLDIRDSPVHVHQRTLEVYVILEGSGHMVLGDEVNYVSKGNVIIIPPRIRHGLVSLDPLNPVKVLITFTPGLAPKDMFLHRDETILADRTSLFIREDDRD